MAYVLLIIALIGAGVYTGSVGFYWAAGAMIALVITVQVLAGFAAIKIAKSVKKEFSDFDAKFKRHF